MNSSIIVQKVIKTSQFIFAQGVKWTKFFGTMIIYCVAAVFGIMIFFAVPLSKFSNPKFDSLPITNYCFAIMGGCASICFSWSRNVDQNNKKLLRQITFFGERCFLSAICFVVASTMKFFVINKTEYFNKASLGTLGVIQIAAFSAFCLSLLLGIIALFYIVRLLAPRMQQGEQFDEL